jgi:type IV secretory pathway component VirB8
MQDKTPDEDGEDVNGSVHSGDYFEQAKSWYHESFFLPIAHRNLFQISALLASFIALIALVSCMALLPVNERVTIPVATPNIDDIAIESVYLGKRGTSANDAFLEFFVKEYVTRRESYAFHDYQKNRSFVKANSDPITFAKYDRLFNVSNPRSPAALLGQRGERVIDVQSYRLNADVSPPIATVEFSVEVLGKETLPKTYWTASLAFYYDSLIVEEVTDPETGALSLRTQDPVFNVVKYVVSKVK